MSGIMASEGSNGQQSVTYKVLLKMKSANTNAYKDSWNWFLVGYFQCVFALILVCSCFYGCSLFRNRSHSAAPCHDVCKFQLVESLPENLTYPPGSISFPSTFTVWKDLISNAKHSIDLGVFYWTLNNSDVSPTHFASSWQGEEIFSNLLESGRDRGIQIRIAQNAPTKSSPQIDSQVLKQNANAQVVNLDFNHLIGGGILHTKLWIVDGKHIYIGSANMDWRALTQVKEAGILIQNCSCLAEDLLKIFKVYWYLGETNEVPPSWPSGLDTKYDIEHPMDILNSPIKSKIFVSSSPKQFNPSKRTNDIDAILHIINSAEKFIHIAVMDYFPRLLYSGHLRFWPLIDNALRQAALERKVKVRLLASHWSHTRKDMVRWLKSLQDLSGDSYPSVSIQTRLFVVPAYTPEQESIPFARVNHNKYMVTDQVAYIGTSNWSGDYFETTAGVGICINETVPEDLIDKAGTPSIRFQLESLFERDWNSEFSKPIEEFL